MYKTSLRLSPFRQASKVSNKRVTGEFVDTVGGKSILMSFLTSPDLVKGYENLEKQLMRFVGV